MNLLFNILRVIGISVLFVIWISILTYLDNKGIVKINDGPYKEYILWWYYIGGGVIFSGLVDIILPDK